MPKIKIINSKGKAVAIMRTISGKYPLVPINEPKTISYFSEHRSIPITDEEFNKLYEKDF